MNLFSARQEIFQGGEVLVHIFQPLGDTHGHAFVELACHGGAFVQQRTEGGDGDDGDLAIFHGHA